MGTDVAGTADTANHLKVGGKVDAVLTDRSVHEVVNGAIQLAHLILDWSQSNPLLFLGLLVFLGFAAFQWRKAATEKRALELEYDQERRNVADRMSQPSIANLNPPDDDQ